MMSWDESPEIDRLVWDEWNTEHIAKHGVTPDEVGQAIEGAAVARASYKGRYLVLGPSKAGSLLAVVIGPEPGNPGAFYTFSARPASGSERRLYQNAIGGTEP